MRKTRFLLPVLLVGALAALPALVGCTSNDISDANTTAGNTTGEVRVKVASPKGTSVVSPMSFSVATLMPAGWTPSAGTLPVIGGSGDIPAPPASGSQPSTNPGSLVGQYLVSLIGGSTPVSFPSTGGYADLGTAQVPAGIYDRIQVIAEGVGCGTLPGADLPFNPSTLSGILPIIGGMRVNPGDTLTLLLDLGTGQAQLIGDGGW